MEELTGIATSKMSTNKRLYRFDLYGSKCTEMVTNYSSAMSSFSLELQYFRNS